tara:strand:+ start:55 stop:726 length:672 start_codon:yes stop_codon:yes gene_type:complete
VDELDKLIVDQLFEDSRRSVTEIAQAISLSHSATRIRLGKLVDSGVIKRFTIELAEDTGKSASSPKEENKLLEVSCAFVDFRIETSEDLDKFILLANQIPEITAAFSLHDKFNCRIFMDCEDSKSLTNLIDAVKEGLSVEVIQSCGVERSLIGFNLHQTNGTRNELDPEYASSREKTDCAEPKEFGNDLLQFEISAMEKSSYMDPGEEQKVIRMAVKLVESNN